MKALRQFIASNCESGFIRSSALLEAARQFQMMPRDVEITSLREGITPLRYQRNIGSISIEQQTILRSCRCAIIGCGGLGGYIVEELARLGVGAITAVDHDVFAESNLNRQCLSDVETIGLPKVDAAQKKVKQINPAVDFIGHQEMLCDDNADFLVGDADIVLDALDNFDARRILLDACIGMRKPIVGGSIAGWYGMVYCCAHPVAGMEMLFSHLQGIGIEKELGNPAFTPALIGSVESALAYKILIGVERKTRGQIFFIDALNISFESFEM